MLIEQIFELRGPGHTGCIRTPITGCFHDKTIFFKENIRLDRYLLLKYCRKQCTILPPTWAKSLIKFNAQMQDFKHVLDLIASKRRTEQVNFFIAFQMLKKSSTFKWL